MIGRFIQEDTYYGDGLNLYEYCRNNAITYKDPTGHNICPTQRDLYHKYKEEGMSLQEAYQKMRKELGLDSKSGYKDSGVGNGKDPWRSYESGSVTKPNQVHHYATNKSKTYTPQLEEIANRYELDLDDAWNKDLLPHQGRHPNAYHEYVLDSMKQFDNIAQGDKDIFLKLFDNLKNNVKSNPDMLYKDYWK